MYSYLLGPRRRKSISPIVVMRQFKAIMGAGPASSADYLQRLAPRCTAQVQAKARKRLRKK